MTKSLLHLVIFFVLSNAALASTGQYTLAYRDDPSSSIVIGWSGDAGNVHYGLVDLGDKHDLYPNTHPSDRSGKTYRIQRHFARLTGLLPNQLYYFVIHDEAGETSKRYYFRTLSDKREDPVSFISGGDTRDGFKLFGIYLENCPSGDCEERRRDGNKLVAKIRPDFISFTGDFVMNRITSNKHKEWLRWLDDWQLTITDDGRMTPVAFSRGNHEDLQDVYDMFDIPYNEYYALNIHGGLIRLYTLNSELDACTDTNQLHWLQNDLEAHTGTSNDPVWKFANYHKPTVAIGKHGDVAMAQMECWVPLFEKHGVRLVMESDSHTTKWTYPCVRNAAGDDFERTENPNEGIVYIGEGNWGAPHREVFYTGWDAKSYVQDAEAFDNFFFVHVNQQQTHIQCVAFENIDSVASVTDNELGGGLPSNVVLWEPYHGNEITLINNAFLLPIKEKNTRVSYDHENAEVTVTFLSDFESATIEIYDKDGQRCLSRSVAQLGPFVLDIDEACRSAKSLYIRYQNGMVETHPILRK